MATGETSLATYFEVAYELQCLYTDFKKSKEDYFMTFLLCHVNCPFVVCTSRFNPESTPPLSGF